jgi:hypothetical protein
MHQAVIGAGFDGVHPSGLRKTLTVGARDHFEFSYFLNPLQNG